MDLLMTRDNVPLVSHDKDLFRLTGIYGEVKNYDYSKLPKFINSYDVAFSPDLTYTRKSSDPVTF